MTNFPDSGWITSIQKIEWWVSASVATAAALILSLAVCGAPWFGLLPPTIAMAIAIVGVLFSCLLMFKVIDIAFRAFKRNRESKVRRRIDQLSDYQQQFLAGVFRSGGRSFDLPPNSGSPRWIEELVSWNYIEWHAPIVITADTREYYSVTEDGWNQLEKIHGKSL